MITYLRFCLICAYLLTISLPVCSKAMLHGTVAFLNSGSKPAQGVKISAFGAQASYTNQDGKFSLEFPEKRPGDRVRISVGGKDENGVAFVVVNDKILASLHLPSDPDVDIVEIFVCPQERLDEEKQKYYGIFAKDIHAKTEKRLRKIEQGIMAATASKETVESLQREKEKLLAERDSALAKAEEQALYIASINLDKANHLVRDAVYKLNVEEDVAGAIAVLDNEALCQAYLKASGLKATAEKEIRQVLDGFEMKIHMLQTGSNEKEIQECCKYIGMICKREKIDPPTASGCFSWVVVDQRPIPHESPQSGPIPATWSPNGNLSKPTTGSIPFPRDDAGLQFHLVKNGDTLYSIARMYNTSVASLKASNKLDNMDMIVVGQRILVPVK